MQSPVEERKESVMVNMCLDSKKKKKKEGRGGEGVGVAIQSQDLRSSSAPSA